MEENGKIECSWLVGTVGLRGWHLNNLASYSEASQVVLSGVLVGWKIFNLQMRAQGCNNRGGIPIVSWLTQSDQSDCSIRGGYFSYTPPRRCIFFALGLDLLRILGPWWQHASFTSKTPILT